ncbi:MMPL family transporter [Desulfovibrio sp. Huiquan2017]|uniref:MMPL family transporter n=1 Tax=Desulfovibrio sp. Huiquan2017 TaxID=2816861 RepID=UPI001A91A4F4|nr:MMPL family transporter [Desulfovibrio sp. Huiquan2017]
MGFSGKRRWAPVLLTLAIMAACLTLFAVTPVRTDIRAMLPVGEQGMLARDFDRLTHSSLANNVFISLHAAPEVSRAKLIQSAEQMIDALAGHGLAFVCPSSVNPLRAMTFLLDNSVNLMTAADLDAVKPQLKPEAVRTALSRDVRLLAKPQGIALKSLVRRDPLGWRSRLGARLKHLAGFTEAHVENGHIFSKDRRSILLTAKPETRLTDADGAARLVAEFQSVKRALPSGITADMVGGQVHTNANASVIKQDLVVISVAAAAFLVLLFFLFFRSRRALSVFAAPLVAMAAGLGGAALFGQTVSAIVIGFGSVLVGISIDFAMHVYFAMRRQPERPALAVHAVARPVIYCALTSCAAFGALFLSDIPGIRQLAVFAIAGLVASVLFSLLVLPAFGAGALPERRKRSIPLPSLPVVVTLPLWGALLLGCLWCALPTSLDPDLRSVGYRPASVRDAEARFTAVWGDMRSRGVVFAEGRSVETALSANDKVYDALRADLPDVAASSLAPLVPSRGTQKGNRARWDAFWARGRREHTIEVLLAEAGDLGFSSVAFTPFLQGLNRMPEPITPHSLDQGSLGFLRDIFMPDLGLDKATVLTFLPDSEQVRAYFSPEREQKLGVRLVSNGRFKAMLESAMKTDIRSFISFSGLCVVLLIFLLYRNVRRSLLAVLPAVTGVAAVFGGLGLTGTPLNLFHITALPLVIGLGADYGIVQVNREHESLDLDTTTAVLASGVTTLAGFGVLILASHPSLHAMGITVVLGVGVALATALLLLPNLLRRAE